MVIIADVELLNPIMNASGCLCRTEDELLDLYNSNFGAVVSKSCTLLPRNGNPEPRYYYDNFGSVNSSGLPNLGYKFYANLYKTFTKKPYIISVGGLSLDDNCIILKYLNENAILDKNLVEINLSCPNIIGKPQIG